VQSPLLRPETDVAKPTHLQAGKIPVLNAGSRRHHMEGGEFAMARKNKDKGGQKTKPPKHKK
jgi:hypothetical protein